MSWIVASVIMFISSVVMYLLVRKSSLSGVSNQINNLAMFSIPLVVYFIIGNFTGANFLLTPFQILVIFVTALFFCFLGNVLSLRGIEYAPNPGYSLVLSKSYVVFTTLVAVVILNSQISVLKTIAILAIVGFSALIMVGKPTKKKVNKLWLPFSIGAFFCWGMLSLVSKYILSQQVNIFSYLCYLYLFVTVFIVIDAARNSTNIKNIKELPWVFWAIGIVSSVFNVCMFYAVGTAPNLGYVNAINVSSISLVTIFASLLFKDELNLKKIIGVFGVIIGCVLLLL